MIWHLSSQLAMSPCVTLIAVSAHLQQLDEGVMLVFGRDVYEAIHQQDADEVTHLLPRRMRQARS